MQKMQEDLKKKWIEGALQERSQDDQKKVMNDISDHDSDHGY